MKFECCHADTCCSDFWSGHHAPHVQILAIPGMSLVDVKEAIEQEINQDAIAGSYLPDEQPEEWYEALIEATNKLEPARPEIVSFFNDIEESEDSDVYAFFVFIEQDEEDE